MFLILALYHIGKRLQPYSLKIKRKNKILSNCHKSLLSKDLRFSRPAPLDLSRCGQRVYVNSSRGLGFLSGYSRPLRFHTGFSFLWELGGILSHPSPHDAAHFWGVPAIQYDLPCFRSRERQGFQPSTAHWTILLTEIVPVPRACLGGFPDSISLASHRPVSDPSGIAANFNRCLFSHQSYELWFPKSVLRQIAGVEPNAG